MAGTTHEDNLHPLAGAPWVVATLNQLADNPDSLRHVYDVTQRQLADARRHGINAGRVALAAIWLIHQTRRWFDLVEHPEHEPVTTSADLSDLGTHIANQLLPCATHRWAGVALREHDGTVRSGTMCSDCYAVRWQR